MGVVEPKPQNFKGVEVETHSKKILSELRTKSSKIFEEGVVEKI